MCATTWLQTKTSKSRFNIEKLDIKTFMHVVNDTVVSVDDIYGGNRAKRETHSRELDKLGLNPDSQIASIIKDKYHISSLLLP